MKSIGSKMLLRTFWKDMIKLQLQADILPQIRPQTHGYERHARALTHTHTHTRTHTHTHARTHARMHARTHTLPQTRTQTQAHEWHIHTHTRMHARHSIPPYIIYRQKTIDRNVNTVVTLAFFSPSIFSTRLLKGLKQW